MQMRYDDGDNAGYDWENQDNNWYDDPNKIVDFVSWYYEGTGSTRPSELIDMFRTPWDWNDEFFAYRTEIEGDDLQYGQALLLVRDVGGSPCSVSSRKGDSQ